ncbi:MAG TPA: NAD(P)/FAD-dependent oxidoreductase [Gemmatales bacterium]|nr:NAD(P)/FAD-dependent oxidoreductase [Gemmatales bacterium]
MSSDWDVIIVGAGAAGLMSATRAAEGGLRTLLLEKAPKPGVKILMSGGTRCNLTHATDRKGILSVFEKQQANFLQSALAAFGPSDLTAYVEAEGIELKTESTGKIFPASDSAVDIQQAFVYRLMRSGAQLQLREAVQGLERDNASGQWTVHTPTRRLTTDRLMVTTGGQSYPGCGTTGDAYRWMAELGHAIVPPRPALVPLTWQVPWANALAGITIPDADVAVIDLSKPAGKQQVLHRSQSSFLFTHIGGSGPAVLNVSKAYTAHPQPDQLRLRCDWLSGVSEAELTTWLLDQTTENGKRQVATILGQRLPHRLVEAIMNVAKVAADRKLSEFSKAERTNVIKGIKQAELPIHGTTGFPKAEVTAGGVSLKEVDSSTLRSKIIPNLWLAGEVLDIDGPIGGYNFQAAFSTGWLAGTSLCGER